MCIYRIRFEIFYNLLYMYNIQIADFFTQNIKYIKHNNMYFDIFLISNKFSVIFKILKYFLKIILPSKCPRTRIIIFSQDSV